MERERSRQIVRERKKDTEIERQRMKEVNERVRKRE